MVAPWRGMTIKSLRVSRQRNYRKSIRNFGDSEKNEKTKRAKTSIIWDLRLEVGGLAKSGMTVVLFLLITSFFSLYLHS